MARKFVVLALLALILAPPGAAAQDASHSPLSSGFRFTESSGEQLFAAVCQGCHMPDAKGAVGAASYPSLADDSTDLRGERLSRVTIVVRGQRGMPGFGYLMSDDQVAAVVNYLRTHFGNDYRDMVTAEDVGAVRPSRR